MGKPTWVFVVGTYRTGSTTQYRIAEEIVQSTCNGIGIGYHTEDRLVENDAREDLPGKGYIVCKVFVYLPETSPHGERFLEEGRVKVLGTTRDPRDIFVSMRERRVRDGQDAGEAFYTETVRKGFRHWLSQFDQWAQIRGAHISRFDVMTRDLPGEVRGIARYLDIPLTEEEIQEIASHYTKEAIRAAKQKIIEAGVHAPPEHPVLPSIPSIVFGTTGQWEEYLEPQDAEEIVNISSTYMKHWGYA